jgi:DNA-binding SARP family transcriptional activator
LLVYLCAHRGRELTRDQLADLLWGDRDLKAARRVFRQALYVIRKGLGRDAVETDGELVRFGGAVSMDLWDFEDALRSGDPQDALDLYGGPFLRGLEIPGAVAFQEWVDRERARVGGMVREAAGAAAESAAGEGRWDAALSALDQHLATDPEDVELLCMKSRMLLAGDRCLESVAVAREALTVLASGAVLDPGGDVRAKLSRLATARETASRQGEGEGGEEPDHGLAVPRLIGRADEFRTLWCQWRACVAGEGRVALVVGDPGIGKTRLIEELLRASETDDATVLRGKSYELEDGLLFGALVDVMRQALKAPGFAAVSDVWLAELSRLLPELVEQYPRLARAVDGAAAVGRRRFHEAVAQVLEALAYEAPVICVLDDLHWADDATLELVHYLARRLCAVPVLLVAGLRPREASDTLRRLQHTLVEEHGGACITLGPLERDAVAALTSSMAHGHPPPDAVEEAVWEASGGNPYLAVSTVGSLVDAGAVEAGPRGWVLPRGEGVALPSTWELIGARIGGLPPGLRDLLELAAAAGRRFTAELLAGPAVEDSAEVGAHLEALVARRILRADRGEDGIHYDFVHDRLREAVYRSIPPERRADRHHRIARGLAGDQGLNACLMARHFHQAGDRAEAYRHALAGAAWARGVFAYGGELEMLDLARANAPDEGNARDLDLRLGALRAEVGQASEESPVRSRRPARGWRGWMSAAAAVVVVAVMGAWLLLPGQGAGGDEGPALPPLPHGLLLAMREGGVLRHAVLDPVNPGARALELPPGHFTLSPLGAPPVLSPDLTRAAFAVADGGPPDVWIQVRDGSGLRRITQDPEDDVPAAWLPDGSGVLIRTIRGRVGSIYGYGLAVVPLEGGPVRMITHGPWSDRAAAVSPDGTRIAVTREFGGTSLWLMDFDGTDARPVLEGLSEVLSIQWAPDGGALAYVERHDEGWRLVVVDLTAAAAVPRVVMAGVAGGVIWNPDGETLYTTAQVDNNAEVFGVPVDGGGAVRLTYTSADESLVAFTGPAPPHVASVEIVRGKGGGELGVLAGDSLSLTVTAWSSVGSPHEGSRPVLRCLDEAVCTVSESGQVVGVGPGETQVIADLQGWRADTVAIRVADGTPRRVLHEDWQQGIDPARWRAFGDPRPVAPEGIGRGGSRGLNPNGDAKYGSGVVSLTPVDWRRGITVEFWARGDFDAPWPSFQGWEVTLLDGVPPDVEGDVRLPAAVASVQVSSGTPDRQPALRFGSYTLRESGTWSAGKWHRYRLRVFPDLRCELWIDEVRGIEVECGRPLGGQVWVCLSGRASHAPVVIEDVEVWEGVG